MKNQEKVKTIRVSTVNYDFMKLESTFSGRFLKGQCDRIILTYRLLKERFPDVYSSIIKAIEEESI